MEVTSELKHLNISPRKIRLIVPIVKGQPVEQALLRLKFTSKRAAKPLSAVIKTARADATTVHKLDAEKLTVKEVNVMEGATLKRFRPRSRGMAHPIFRRTSHLRVTLEG